MGILTTLLTLPVSGPLKGVQWLAGHIAEQAEQEYYNADLIRQHLMELELRYEMGEIDDETYDQLEELLMQRLQMIRERINGGS